MAHSGPLTRVYAFREMKDPASYRTECRHYHRFSLNYGSARGAVKYTGGPLADGPHTCEDFVCAKVMPDGEDNVMDNSLAWTKMEAEDLLNEKLSGKQAPYRVRIRQADAARKAGYTGPIKGGEARAMAGILREMGKSDCVRRLYVYKTIERERYPGTPYARKYTTERLVGPVYAFKPVLEGYTFADFIRIVRMIRPGTKNARQAIREAMNNPNMKDDLTMLQGLDILCNMKGGT